MALDKEVVHTSMPKRVEKAKIALLNSPLEIEKTEMSAEIRISEPAANANVSRRREQNAKGNGR